MKKLFCFVLSVLFSISLVACKTQSTQEKIVVEDNVLKTKYEDALKNGKLEEAKTQLDQEETDDNSDIVLLEEYSVSQISDKEIEELAGAISNMKVDLEETITILDDDASLFGVTGFYCVDENDAGYRIVTFVSDGIYLEDKAKEMYAYLEEIFGKNYCKDKMDDQYPVLIDDITKAGIYIYEDGEGGLSIDWHTGWYE